MSDLRDQEKPNKNRLLSARYLLPVIAILAVVLFVTAFFLHSGADTAGKTQPSAVSETTQESSASENSSGEVSSKAQKTERLLALSYKEKLSYMKAHKKLYPKRYRKMAREYPETVNFVLQYPQRHKKKYRIDLTREAKSKKVPLLIQWDKRWGYRDYGDGAIGYTGCGPTCISMVAIYLTGNARYTPLKVARYADKHHYYINGQGTKWDFISDGCEAFHIKATEIPIEKQAIRNQLKEHHPVVCSVSEGDFTDNGHFIVLTSCKGGKFTIHDPNSRINSRKKWSWKRLNGQIRCCWAYRRS